MLRCFALLLFAYGAVGYGYDSGGGDQASCGRPYRTGRNYQPPCDLSKHGYCDDAGELYPWRAVRRFVKDNQGLMRRMYGDQRQAHVLRIELDPDTFDEEWGQPTRNFNEWREPYHKRYSRHQNEEELDIDNELSPMPDDDSSFEEENPYGESRYLRDDPNSVADVLKTKFVYSQHEPAVLIKLAGLKTASRYRATTQRTTTATPKTPTTERTTPTTTNKSTTTKPSSTLRTFPPRNTNPKKIYSARNTASTSSTTRRSLSFRTTTPRITTTTSKSNTTENKQTTTPSTNATLKLKLEVDMSTVASSKKPIYITRDSAATNKFGNGKNDGTTTEALTTESTTFTPTGTTSSTEFSELTTDTTASPEHFSTTTPKMQPVTTPPENKPTNETHSNPINLPIERIDDEDSIEVLSEKNTSAERFVFNDKKVDVLKSESEYFEDLKHINNQSDDTNDNDQTAEELNLEDKISAEISVENSENDKDNIETDANVNHSDGQDSEVNGSETDVHKVNAPASGNTPVDTMLFQDMEDNTDKKVTVDFNQKGVNACPAKEEVVAPFWANNTRGEVLALLNMYPFEQYVHWEKCTFEHRQMYCREGCRCEQQYRLHRLLAYDPNNECRGIFSDWFRFPSCCICKCYNIPAEFRVTSRSPRLQRTFHEEDLDYDDNIT